jgi:hypothetical protein
MSWVTFTQRFIVLPLALIVILPSAAQPQQPPVKFRTKATYGSGGYGANSIAIDDLNRDGHPDLVVANACPTVGCISDNAGQVGVLIGNGDGTFQTAVSYPSGGSDATSVAIADVNGDGKPDLVVANRCRTGLDCSVDDSGEVSVLLGNGNGTFAPAVSYASGGYSARSVVVADMNRDGRPDLLVANECNSLECAVSVRGAVGVLLGNGDGMFQPPVSYDTGSGHALSLAVGHLNGDANLDIAVANRCFNFSGGSCNSGVGVIGILFGNGDGTFQNAVTYFFGGWSISTIAVDDVSGDGRPDLVVTDDRTAGFGHVGVLLNNGDGTFQAATLYTVGQEATSVAIGDVNGDGFPDIAVVNICQKGSCLNGRVSFLPGIGNGAFPGGAAAAYTSSGTLADATSIGDLNGDGRPDVVVTNFCADDQTCIQHSGNGSVSVLVNSLILATTTTAITSSSNPVKVNQPVTFTATVSSSRPVPDGERVTFSIGTTKIGTGATANGIAILTTSFSKSMTSTIKASYAGFDYLGPSSATIKQVVTP